MKVTNDRRQRADDEHCGAVCAAVALDLCGFAPDEATARVARGLPVTSLDGVDPRTMEAFLRRQGLRCQSGEMTVKDLAHHTRQGRPVLCLVADHGGHWVVVTGTYSRSVAYHDPMDGTRARTPAEWEAAWYDVDRYGCEYRRFGLAVWKE
ncbi:MAG TPA: cysteine peptidase family C39 domain-containing protein [bacterium]|nr:cysteine peptidase family C39 domain-containing protein [bacterium]